MNTSKGATCQISENMAHNLRVRSDDMIKVVPIGSEGEGEHSGDLLLVEQQPVDVESLTLSPIEDSLRELEAAEGELSDEEIQERFVQPYTDNADGALVKQDTVLSLKDANGKKLEFIVTHVAVEGAPEEDEGMFRGSRVCWFTRQLSLPFQRAMRLSPWLARLQRRRNSF